MQDPGEEGKNVTVNNNRTKAEKQGQRKNFQRQTMRSRRASKQTNVTVLMVLQRKRKKQKLARTRRSSMTLPRNSLGSTVSQKDLSMTRMEIQLWEQNNNLSVGLNTSTIY